MSRLCKGAYTKQQISGCCGVCFCWNGGETLCAKIHLPAKTSLCTSLPSMKLASTKLGLHEVEAPLNPPPQNIKPPPNTATDSPLTKKHRKMWIRNLMKFFFKWNFLSKSSNINTISLGIWCIFMLYRHEAPKKILETIDYSPRNSWFFAQI